jgi:hypothetical protein
MTAQLSRSLLVCISIIFYITGRLINYKFGSFDAPVLCSDSVHNPQGQHVNVSIKFCIGFRTLAKVSRFLLSVSASVVQLQRARL